MMDGRQYESTANAVHMVLDLTGVTPEGKIDPSHICVLSSDESMDAFDFYLAGENEALNLAFDQCYTLITPVEMSLNVFTGHGDEVVPKILDAGTWYINTSQIGLFSVAEVGLDALVSNEEEVCLTLFEEDSA
jgi:hypothetical protein